MWGKEETILVYTYSVWTLQNLTIGTASGPSFSFTLCAICLRYGSANNMKVPWPRTPAWDSNTCNICGKEGSHKHAVTCSRTEQIFCVQVMGWKKKVLCTVAFSLGLISQQNTQSSIISYREQSAYSFPHASCLQFHTCLCTSSNLKDKIINNDICEALQQSAAGFHVLVKPLPCFGEGCAATPLNHVWHQGPL